MKIRKSSLILMALFWLIPAVYSKTVIIPLDFKYGLPYFNIFLNADSNPVFTLLDTGGGVVSVYLSREKAAVRRIPITADLLKLPAFRPGYFVYN